MSNSTHLIHLRLDGNVSRTQTCLPVLPCDQWTHKSLTDVISIFVVLCQEENESMKYKKYELTISQV